ncbi:hypothetical protein OUZ56_028132 [Daphnia magna]|uniref:Uncharacterized protein n=1 Tax=Daphnia magna TaxID=35525 RepID=A0ABR0B2Y7_9CRUS|nr:hypothetical protein OUZ56_028132 [Daphnia magna]
MYFKPNLKFFRLSDFDVLKELSQNEIDRGNLQEQKKSCATASKIRKRIKDTYETLKSTRMGRLNCSALLCHSADKNGDSTGSCCVISSTKGDQSQRHSI